MSADGEHSPSGGSASIDGSISSFTDLTLGMDPEATGWDNIVFRCAFMGLSFQEAKRLSSAIADFSELGDYLNLPTRFRHAPLPSRHPEPDILIMDEMIASGDAKFIEKAKRRLHELVDKANILALASHDMKIIEQICNKALWLEHGVVKLLGPPDIVPRRKASRAPRQ